jgi:hypothetical protein
MSKPATTTFSELWRAATRPLYHTHLTPQEIAERLKNG